MAVVETETQISTDLDRLYDGFAAAGLTALWTEIEGLMPLAPQPAAVPHVWRRADVVPLVEQSIDLVPVGRGGERRAIAFSNPGLPGRPYATPTLWAALQALGPREVAPAHRHSQGAFRFIIEGEGVWTVVNGDPVVMRPGDLLLTPAWFWHEHHNIGSAPMFWLDGLDIPLVRQLDAGFFEFGPDELTDTSTPQVARCERLWSGPGLRPVAVADSPVSPLLVYRREQIDAALAAQLDLADAGHPGAIAVGHAAVRATNPTTGADALPTMRLEMHRLRAGTHSESVRQVASSVWLVYSGSGSVHLDGQTKAVGAGDVVAVPSWTEVSWQAGATLDLFTFSDLPVFEKLGLDRREVTR
jgi:gentisate 1,2-dioxygenase